MTDKKTILPLLPLRGVIVFPNMVMHLDVGRERSVNALEQAMMEDNKILLVSQKKRVLTNLHRKTFTQWGPLPR